MAKSMSRRRKTLDQRLDDANMLQKKLALQSKIATLQAELKDLRRK